MTEITCYWCRRRLTLPQLTGTGAPSGETMPTMIVPDGWIEEPADGHGRLLCDNCVTNDEIIEYMTDLDEADEIIARQCEREIRRREPTPDEAAADEQARLVFGVEPHDTDDYGSLA